MSGEATTAASLAADPTDCAANQFADVIAANGNLTCSAIVDADIPDDITITNAVYTTDFPLNQDTTGSAASTTGNSATATALAANGANCAADHYALGVDASGAVESCTADANTTYASSDFTLSDIGGSVTDAQVPDDITITLAGTATALAADPANCVTATHFAVGVDAGGVAECEAIADADVPNDITITLAATATASADNPTDCAAGSYPLGVDANWDVANCTDASTEIDSIVATHMAIVGTTSITGHITDTDWDTFNNKAPTTSPTFATSITGSYLTASELLSTNASSEIVSLAVATYPSLTELSYVKGLSSAIQTQLNAKAPSASPTITTKMTLDYATASELVSTNASKELVSLAVATYPSLTELSYVKGLSSAVQTQLNAKDAVTTAGRSLTRTTNDFVADEETYIYKAKIAFEDPVATDDFVFGELTHAVTFTSIYCKTLVGTVTLDVTSGGTDIEGTDIVCDTDGQSDAGISNASGSASDEIKLAITSVASAPTYLFLQLNGTMDD